MVTVIELGVLLGMAVSISSFAMALWFIIGFFYAPSTDQS